MTYKELKLLVNFFGDVKLITLKGKLQLNLRSIIFNASFYFVHLHWNLYKID